MALKNPRHERFANFVAQGKTQYEAYELCGYKFSNGNPCKLASNPAVAQRIKEILAGQAARSAVTAESLIREADETRLAAMASGQNNAACSAIKIKAVLSGAWIERAEIGTPGEYDHLADADLERLLAERIAQLGFADDGEDVGEAGLARMPIDDTQH